MLVLTVKDLYLILYWYTILVKEKVFLKSLLFPVLLLITVLKVTEEMFGKVKVVCRQMFKADRRRSDLRA